DAPSYSSGPPDRAATSRMACTGSRRPSDRPCPAEEANRDVSARGRAFARDVDRADAVAGVPSHNALRGEGWCCRTRVTGADLGHRRRDAALEREASAGNYRDGLRIGGDLIEVHPVAPDARRDLVLEVHVERPVRRALEVRVDGDAVKA